MDFYKSLVQVDCTNQSIIIDISDNEFQREVQVLYNTEWFTNQQKFIDTGFNHDGAEVNENRSLLLHEGMLYTMYTPMDLLAINEFQNALETVSKLPEIDLETILATFEGQTIYSIFFEDISAYEYITSKLKDAEFEDEERNGMAIEDEILRRLMQLLQMPVRQLQSTKKLSDRTRIAGTTWANLKDKAIDDD